MLSDAQDAGSRVGLDVGSWNSEMEFGPWAECLDITKAEVGSGR